MTCVIGQSKAHGSTSVEGSVHLRPLRALRPRRRALAQQEAAEQNAHVSGEGHHQHGQEPAGPGKDGEEAEVVPRGPAGFAQGIG